MTFYDAILTFKSNSTRRVNYICRKSFASILYTYTYTGYYVNIEMAKYFEKYTLDKKIEKKCMESF